MGGSRKDRIIENLRRCDWVYGEHVWDVSTLSILLPRAWHAVWVSWVDSGVDLGWHVNLQRPFRRTALGIEAMDLMLDVVVEPDLTWRWKDDDEFEEIVDRGILDPSTAQRVRAEAAAVIATIDRAAATFSEPRPTWHLTPTGAAPSSSTAGSRCTRRDVLLCRSRRKAPMRTPTADCRRDQAGAMQFVLVHSALVGPGTWRRVADVLRAAGHDVEVPDLRAAAVGGRREAVVAAAVAEIPRDWSTPVVVGHSGAGPILPLVAAGVGQRVPRLVFVDAGLPPCAGSTTPAAGFLEHLRPMAVDGLLPEWSTWWGEGVMEALVPAADRRAEVEAEMPAVPLAFFESSFDVPAGWCETPGAFLLLSEPYRQDAERAQALGWRIVERLGSHLDMVNDPDAIAPVIIDLGT